MLVAPSRSIVLELALALGFAAATLIADRVLVPVVLYDTPGCPQYPALCVPVRPDLHLVPLLAGTLATVIGTWLRQRRVSVEAVVAGIGLGLASTMLVGAFDAARVPFQDPYFTLPYRVYGVALLAAFVALTAVFSTQAARRPDGIARIVGLGLLAVIAGRILVEAVFGLGLLALAGAVGTAAGGLAGTSLRGPTYRVVSDLSERKVLLLLIGLAFGARLFFGLQTLIRTGPGMAFAVASDDGDSYYTLAGRLAEDPAQLGAALAAIAFPPGYTLFVATLLALSGGGLALVVAAQAVLAAGSTALVHLLARPVAGPQVALTAAALFAADQNLIQNQSTLTAEALLLPLVLGALTSLIRYRATGSVGWLALGSVAIGAAFVTRNAVGAPLAVAAFGWLLMGGRGSPLRAVASGAAILLAIALFSLPIGIATLQRDGAFRPVTQLGRVAWMFDGGPGMTISNTALLERGIDPFGDPLGSAGRVLTDPLPVLAFYAEAAPQRLSTLLFSANRGYSDPLTIVNDVTFPNAFGETIRLIRLAALLLVVGYVVRDRTWRRSPEVGLLIAYSVLYVLVFTVVFAPYHPFRYRIPIEPIRFMAEAAGLILLTGLFARSLRAGPSVVTQARTGARATTDHT